MEPEANTIEAQAAEWVALRESRRLSAEEQAKLNAWIAVDCRHEGALLQAECAWLDLDRIAALRGAKGSPRAMGRSVSVTRWGIAAGLAALALTAGAIWYLQRDPAEVYASVVGEVRDIQLSDGSRLALNTNSVASVQFRPRTRDISLKKGEALFNVAHDANRPFVVHANNVQVRAIGTAFTVRLNGARTDVIVTEGTVEVTRDGAAVRDTRRVTAGQRALLISPLNPPDIEPVQPEDIERELAWREGKVSFAGEPLGTAAAEINRHSRRQIVVDDPDLATQPVVGVFNANDTDAFASAVAASFNAEVMIQGTEIHLR